MQIASLSRSLAFEVVPSRSRTLGALVETIERERTLLEEKLLQHGALLFRGWKVESVADLASFVGSFSRGAPPFGYAGGASPRKALGEGSYTSTEYPQELQLSLHNELSYADVYPARLYFLCLVEPQVGGETTLGDSRRILARIDPAVADKFREKQLRYVRNLSPVKGSGYSWQEALETDDPEQAEACCRRIGADFEWRAGGVLRMSQVRPATLSHPATGEEVWFNQADGFHPSGLDVRTYAELMAISGSEDEFRLNVTYGDGTPIERRALDHIRDVIRSETVPHRWRRGDVLVIDNLLAAHGRMPFSGPRKIALAMT